MWGEGMWRGGFDMDKDGGERSSKNITDLLFSPLSRFQRPVVGTPGAALSRVTPGDRAHPVSPGPCPVSAALLIPAASATGLWARDCRQSSHGCCLARPHTASLGPQWQGCPGSSLVSAEQVGASPPPGSEGRAGLCSEWVGWVSRAPEQDSRAVVAELPSVGRTGDLASLPLSSLTCWVRKKKTPHSLCRGQPVEM